MSQDAFCAVETSRMYAAAFSRENYFGVKDTLASPAKTLIFFSSDFLGQGENFSNFVFVIEKFRVRHQYKISAVCSLLRSLAFQGK